jgi:lipopolysaccharide/colanic/teichoic acid biosynthesis glycosyltransferase
LLRNTTRTGGAGAAIRPGPDGAGAIRVRALHDVHPLRADQSAAPATRRPIGGRLKRASDIVVAGTLLLVLSPVLLLVALAVRLESRGPALFTQRRGGYRAKPFVIFKFRTMTTLEDGREMVQAARGDKRITRLGGFLRKTSIDELPQLLNVLRGDMSLVSPRPHALVHDREFAAIEPSYRGRFTARPGITGLAQVCGARGATETSEAVRIRVRHDLDYVGAWTLLRDVEILVRTGLLVFRDRNAF